MIVTIYVVLLVLCLYSSTLSKRYKFLEFSIVGCIVYLMGRGAKTLDTYNYKKSYQDSLFSSFDQAYEKGYLLLEKVAQFLSFDYIQFRIVLTIISWLLLRKTFNYFTNNTSIIYFLYSIVFIFIDTVQIRNFVAFSIVIYGVRFLFKSQNKSRFKFLLFVLLASTIHTTSLAYIPLVLIKHKNKQKLVYFLVSFTLVICVFIFLTGNRIPLLFELIASVNIDKFEAYLINTTNFGFLYAFFLHFFSIVLLFFTLKINKSNERKNENFDISKQQIIEGIYWINIISILFFPLYMVNLQFIRLCRNLMILNLIAFSLVQTSYFRRSPKLITLNIFIITDIACWFYLTFIIQDHDDDIIDPFFDPVNILS